MVELWIETPVITVQLRVMSSSYSLMVELPVVTRLASVRFTLRGRYHSVMVNTTSCGVVNFGSIPSDISMQ